MTAMTPRVLARKIKELRVTAPITATYEHALITRGIWNDEGVWYSSQKEHWLGWLREYDGPGAYGRQVWTGRSAEYVYGRIGCPPMLLWLAEAAGVSRSKVLAAKRSALSGRPNRATHCAKIRKAIPWSVIEARLLGTAYRGDCLMHTARRTIGPTRRSWVPL
jgi:hypothetical protein